MKHNYVAKHMNTFNKASVHKNIRKESLMNDELAIQEGLTEVSHNSIDNTKLDSVKDNGESK